jgi:hypothetical protein
MNKDTVIEGTIPVQTESGISYLYLFKIGHEEEMHEPQVSAYKFEPRSGKLIDADDETVYISGIPSMKGKGYTFKIRVERFYHHRSEQYRYLYHVTRLT